MKIKSLFAGFLAMVMCVGAMSISAFAAESDEPVVDTTAKTVTVSNEDQFMAISDYSNSASDTKEYPRTFSGWTVVITDDLDMAGYDWAPLVNFYGSMTGKVGDRTNATISNVIVSVEENAGLCANSANGTFSYLTIANSSFETTKSGENVGNYAGAFAANGFTSKFNYCNVVDTIVSGNRFVGGITGYCYGNITNCTVKGSGTVISASPDGNILNRQHCGDNAGGIVGFMGEGSMTVSGCTVEGITVSGSRQVAGIAGLAEYGNTLSNNTVKDTKLIASWSLNISLRNTTASVGGVVGQLQATGATITISDNIVENLSVVRTSGNTNYCGWLIGDVTRGSNYTYTDNTYIGTPTLPEVYGVN